MAWNISIAGVCVFFRLGEMNGWVMQRDKRINRRSKFLLLLAGFVVWMAHLQYSTQWSSGWIDRQNRQAERQTWPVISVD